MNYKRELHNTKEGDHAWQIRKLESIHGSSFGKEEGHHAHEK